MIDPSPHAASPAHITAVVVLYGHAPSESAALRSFLVAVDALPGAPQRLSLCIYDNSAAAHTPPTHSTMSIDYVHDGDNAGLARAYNTGLKRASADGSTWLLLLDQDTTLSTAYLEEMLAATESLQEDVRVGAIVPKLWAGTRLYSPTAPFLWQIRKQLSDKHYAVDMRASGKQEEALTAYNSGAALRVSALAEMGGFPEEFWLDYLDHAVFEELHLRGYRIWVMRTVLQHELSHLDLNAVPLWRHWSVLAAQTRFVLKFGNQVDSLFFRWWLLKTSRTFFHACRDKRVWRLRAGQAFRMRQLSPRYQGSQDA